MFERIRTIKGNRYRYLEKRWRENGKVRSQSWCLGRVDGALYDGKPTNLGHGGYLEQMAQYPSKQDREVSVAPSAPSQPSSQSPGGAPSTTPSSEPDLPSDQD